MRIVNSVLTQFVDFVEHVQEVLLRVDAAAFDTGHNFADHLLTDGRAAFILQSSQFWKQFVMEKLPDTCIGTRVFATR